MTEEVDYSFDEEIATVSVASSGPRAEPDSAALRQFAGYMDAALADPRVKAICVQIEGSARDATADEAPGLSPPPGLLAGDKPIVAGVDGFVTGWKLDAALQSDIRIASTRSGFQFRLTGDGSHPSARLVTWLLPRLIGVSQAFWWLYSGEYLSAREGHELGLICSLVTESEIRETTRRMAEAAIRGGASERAQIRSLLYGGLAQPLAAQLSGR